MQRNGLLAFSVIDCGFGILYLSSSGSVADVALGLNFVLAALLTVLTWQDLRSRGWTWRALSWACPIDSTQEARRPVSQYGWTFSGRRRGVTNMKALGRLDIYDRAVRGKLVAAGERKRLDPLLFYKPSLPIVSSATG